MATTYQHALEVAESLSHDDRLRLIRELMAQVPQPPASSKLKINEHGFLVVKATGRVMTAEQVREELLRQEEEELEDKVG